MLHWIAQRTREVRLTLTSAALVGFATLLALGCTEPAASRVPDTPTPVPVAQASQVWPPRCLAPNYLLHGRLTLGMFGRPRGIQVALEWSADGSELLFASGTEVYAVAADGSQFERLFEASGTFDIGTARYATQPLTAATLAPEGERLAYAVCHEHAPDQTNPQDLDVARCRAIPRPAMTTSRDCRRLPELIRHYAAGPVRVRAGDSFEEILVWDRASRATTRLTAGFAPAWSSDGTRLAFLRRPRSGKSGRGFDLYTVAVGSQKLRWIPGRFSGQPRWSPDGRRLALVGQPAGDSGATLYVVRADGRGSQRLGDTLSDPTWSPDGSRIAFVRVDGPDLALVTIALDGSDERRVTTIERWRDFDWWIPTVAWSPDGSRLLYSCPTICVVTLGGHPVGEQTLASREGYSAVWAPDGSRLAALKHRNWGNADPRVVFTSAPDGAAPHVLVDYDDERGLRGVGVDGNTEPVDVSGCTSGLAVPRPAANPGLVGDCEILLRARPVLAGAAPAALNWSAERPMAEWHGVKLGGDPPRVHVLTVGGRANGRIPPDLGGLTQLRELSLFGSVGGTIPPELGRLAQLRRLDLFGSNIHGAIPPALGRLAQLQELLLSLSFISGPIPPELAGLRKLEYLGARGAFLEGPIPPELGQLANLRGLDLSGNRLTGPIPAELEALANLKTLRLQWNQLTGCIPPGLRARLDQTGCL